MFRFSACDAALDLVAILRQTKEDLMIVTRRFRDVLATAALCMTVILATSTIARAQQCQPGIDAAWASYKPAYEFMPTYDVMWTTLTPNIANLTRLLDTVSDQSSYEMLLGAARSIAARIGGRLVVTLPDGSVVVDTDRPDGETPANANSYEHFNARSINENDNTRVAVNAAQMFPCGIAIESKFNPASGLAEVHFAARLGPHLSSSGTARLSRVGGPWDY